VRQSADAYETETRLGGRRIDGVELGGRELSAYDGVDNSKNSAISGHVKDKQLICSPCTTVIYTPCLSTNAPQHPSDPETFRVESCLLFVVSVQTRS
jgi:hypothetical protein